MMPIAMASAQNWNQLVDRFFDQGYYRFNPSQATSDGFHQYDGRLEDYSRSTIDEEVRVLHQFEREFESFPAAALKEEERADREIVVNRIKSQLLTLETIRYWETNPDLYSSTASNAVFTVMSRTFAPPEARLKSAIERELAMPKLLAAARTNLKNPPRIFTEVALEQLPGIISFFQSDVPLAFTAVKDKALLDRFHQANDGVIRELRAYESYLKTDVLPRSGGDFRLGADTYRKKLLYDEMTDVPLERLLQIGYADLRHNQQMLRDTAKKIDPAKTSQQILAEASRDHPAPGQLLQTFQNTLGNLRDYIRQHHIATIPSDVMPKVEETPPFMRALTFASMDTPGPYEQVAKEAFFNVTLPEKSWTPREVEEHMEAFNRGTIISTAVHEVFPGHYVQFLWIKQAPSKVRKLIGANSNIEGWAHYCEQMMMDEGYGGGDLRLRLGQLQDALLRDARFIVGIEMHTGNMTFNQGVDFFVKEGMQARTNGDRETKRGTSDPTYLYYTLGKLEILKLREDYRKLHGAQFSLEEFHNRFLSQGTPPIKVIRRIMLGNDSPVL
jgi:uncharacterized protein (DUF885 family)